MLQIKLPASEGWDERTQKFVNFPEVTFALEHSLISISKWESKWHIPFLNKEQKTPEQIKDYIKCMTITPNIKDEVYDRLTNDHINMIVKYIDDPMTASSVRDRGGKKSREIVTSELIYYWMVALEIPFECQKWHVNRLMMLIQICEVKNQPDKKMSKRNTMQQNAALNALRRQKAHSRG